MRCEGGNVSRLLQAYIIGWALVLGALVVGGGGQANWIAFIAINQQPAYFTSAAVVVWLFYSVPCVVIFAVGFFIVRAARG